MAEIAWTADEVAYVRANWESMRVALIAAHLNRPTNSVISKAHRLGLPRISQEAKAKRMREGQSLYYQNRKTTEGQTIS